MAQRHSDRKDDFLAANLNVEAVRLAAMFGSESSPDSNAREGNSSAALSLSTSILSGLLMPLLPLKCSSLT